MNPQMNEKRHACDGRASHIPADTADGDPNPRHLSRRGFLSAVPKVVTGTAIGAGVLGMGPIGSNEASAQSVPQFPWPYQQLDPVKVAERAYAAFYVKGCMYGVFEGIIGELRETMGAPYSTFPVLMMEYGKGGINGLWGTLCGALNGAAAAINLVSPTPRPVIDEVFFWYNQEVLPNYRPKTPKFEIVSSVAGSPICHASVQNWCEASGLAPNCKERAERCAWLTASVAKYTVEQLNKQATNTFTTVHKRPEDPGNCAACHELLPPAPKKVEHGKNMTCAQCHTDIDELHWHPSQHLQLRWRGKGRLEQADSLSGPWSLAPNQNNPQALPLKSTEPMKFFRTKQ